MDNWMKEFDEKINDQSGCGEGFYSDTFGFIVPERIKDFINTLLAEQAERYADELEESIELNDNNNWAKRCVKLINRLDNLIKKWRDK